METKFASQPHGWRLLCIGIEQRPSRMHVWPSCTQSACSQTSTVLFYAWTMKFMWAQICVGDMRVSCLKAKGWQHHLSQNIGPSTAQSTRPAPPGLSERNECVNEMEPLKYSRFKVHISKSLRKMWGGPGRPSHFASDTHVVWGQGNTTGSSEQIVPHLPKVS